MFQFCRESERKVVVERPNYKKYLIAINPLTTSYRKCIDTAYTLFRKLYLSYAQLNYPERRVTERDLDRHYFKKLTFRVIARCVFACYILLLLKPAMPVIMDTLAHTFWHEAHMKVVHTVNGNQHVHYELCKAAKDDTKDKGAGKVKFEITDDACIVSQILYPLNTAFYKSPLFLEDIQSLPIVFSDPDYLPPKA